MAVYSIIEVGQAQPSPILGLPKYAPVYGNAGRSSGNWTFGATGNYPKPFRSYSQYLNDANFLLGPYCTAEGVSGRLIISTISPNFGQLGFVQQNWLDFDDGPHATDNEGNLYPSKREWWGSSSLKVTIQVPNLMQENQNGTRPVVSCSVAYNGVDPTSAEYYDTDKLLNKWFPEKASEWRTARVNENLYNYMNRTYGLPAAEWYRENPTKPPGANPFLPRGAYVPLATKQADEEKLDNGLVAQLRREEVQVMIGIVKSMPIPSHPAYRNAIDTLDKWAPPGTPNRQKLIDIGVPMPGGV
jgi:hypothetical protein